MIVVGFALSCNAKKKSVKSEDATKQLEMVKEKMISEGFTMGTITAHKDGSGCPFTIKVDDSNIPYLLDPVNIEDGFKKDGLMVWVKYIPMRMKNRCEGANPVTVSEMKAVEQ